MGKQIILLTSNRAFGQDQHKTLVQYGGYEVFLAENTARALEIAQIHAPFLAILEASSLNQHPGKFIEALQLRRPALKILFILPDMAGGGKALRDFQPEAILKQPLHPQELLHKVIELEQGRPFDVRVQEALPDEAPEPALETAAGAPVDSPPFSWLEDIDLAAQHLTQLSLESAAKAALIVRKTELYAYAGEFAYPGASALAEAVGQQWHQRRGSDLVQFVKLDDGNEYMMYATHLVDELVLALIFDAQMPFTKIRTQANRLALELSGDRQAVVSQETAGTEPAIDLVEDTGPQWVRTPEAAAQPQPEMQNAPTDLDLHDLPETVEEAGVNPENPDPALDWEPANFEDEKLPLPGEALDPFPALNIPADWRPTSGIAEGPRSFLQDLIDDPLPAVALPYDQNESEAAPEGQPQPPIRDPEPLIPHFPNPEAMDETRPTSVSPEKNPVITFPESEDTSYFRATYACVLVPRLPQHHLVRDLAKILEDWMPQICVSFDWRMEHLSIRPEYMQWMAQIRSETAPGYHVKIITQFTSNKIFYNLPRLADENPSGEFWAPGRLMVTSDKLLHPRMVQEFIQKTRRRQGLL